MIVVVLLHLAVLVVLVWITGPWFVAASITVIMLFVAAMMLRDADLFSPTHVPYEAGFDEDGRMTLTRPTDSEKEP